LGGGVATPLAVFYLLLSAPARAGVRLGPHRAGGWLSRAFLCGHAAGCADARPS